MTIELLPLIGVEGIVIFSLIFLASLGLAGFRLSAAATFGQSTHDSSAGSRLHVRQRLVKRFTAPNTPSVKRSPSRHGLEAMGWVLAKARNSAAKIRANQPKIVSDRSIARRVKAPDVVRAVQSGDERDLVDESRAGVAGNELQRMDPEDQWGRVNKIVTEGLGKAKEIESLHEAAARQLDAVDYAYERMLVELRDVLPGVVESRSVCRTNRDADYAAVDSDFVSPTIGEPMNSSPETLEANSTDHSRGTSPGQRAAMSNGRKPRDAEAEAAAPAAA